MSITTISGGIFNFITPGYTPPTFSGSIYAFGKQKISSTSSIGAYINVLYPTYIDLPSTLNVKQLGSTSDIQAYLRAVNPDIRDLSASMQSIQQNYTNLSSSIQPIIGSGYKDLLSSVYPHGPIDLPAIMRVILIKDMTASITGIFTTNFVDVGAFIRSLPTAIHDLSARISSSYNASEYNLPSHIEGLIYKDLLSYISGGHFSVQKNITALINAVPSVNLPASIHSWDFKDLSSIINSVYGPTDIQASIYGISSINLMADVVGCYGTNVPYNLTASIGGYNTKDLSAQINCVVGIDLSASLTAGGTYKDILASIQPRVVSLKKILNIPLLNWNNLGAVINDYCLMSESKNLSSTIRATYLKNLTSYIIGWYGSSTDNVKDLGAYINASTFITEKVFPFTYIPNEYYSKLGFIYEAVNPSITFDTFKIIYNKYYVKNLGASIIGTLIGVDLPASITSETEYPYSLLPPNIKPRTREIVINLNNMHEEWRKTVEVLFNSGETSDITKYIYVEGENKIYKVDRNKTWTILFTAYDDTSGEAIQRRNIVSKKLFNFKDYTTMSDAIKLFIDKAASLRTSDLCSVINCLPKTHYDLNSSISGLPTSNRWVRNLSATINNI